MRNRKKNCFLDSTNARICWTNIFSLCVPLWLTPKAFPMRRFCYFNKGYLHTVIRRLQGLYTIVHLYKIVTFTTLTRVLADDKDTTWNKHGYTSRVMGYTKEIHKEVGAKPEKVKAPSAIPPPGQPSFSFQWA